MSSFALTAHGQHQIDRLAMHIGLMSVLIQGGAPLSLVQSQCVSLRAMLREILDLDDEHPSALIKVAQMLPDDVAEALAHGHVMPDDLSGME